MSDRSFVHLHCHSHFSLLDGAATVPGLINRAKEMGMNALALTDHGNLHGALEFYRCAKAAGINPVIGYEAYIAPGSRFEKGNASGAKDASYHLTLLAKNRTGFQNLVRMASSAYLDGFYFRPRIDKELLEAHSEGIICLSGCVSSEFNRTILRGGDTKTAMAEAKNIASWFHRVFDDRYFIEVQNNGLEIQRMALEGSREVANELGLPIVATSDCHYINQDDAEAQDILLCINTGRFRTDTNRMKMENDQFYLRSPEEMYASFPELQDAVERTQEIANSVDLDLDLTKRHFPVYQVPDEKTPEDYLRELCLEGLHDRYQGNEEMLPDGELSQTVMDRLDRELDVINQLGFPNYFLIVWDFVRYSRELDIPATARGSGVGSLVAYALYMSHVCPLKYDLLFERFLDPSREEAPDIDIDFCKERRGDVINYVKEKYGEANVAQIGTFGTLAARAAIRDVGRAMSMTIPRVDTIVAMVPDELGIRIKSALEKSTDLKKAYDGDPETREMLDLAMKIEGFARNVGTHAAAVVIADRPLTEYVPLCRVQGKTDIITQWAMNDVEAAGLLKMDFLGLRNLTILSKAVDLIEQTTGERIDPHKFPLDDKESYALLCRGETKGIFQMESGGIRDLLQKMKPDHFRDIIATAALYRPGPLEGGMVDDYVQVKNGKKQATYPHEVMKEILEETHGVMVYQEQVMRILNRLGDIGLSDAYKCIKAISKKKLPMIAKFKEQFIENATEKGLEKKKATELFEMIEKFAGYGFNKSHSTAYALIAYQTAYLKAHYPLEFMAALLSGDIPARNFKSKDSLVEHMEDGLRMELEIVSPDVNTCDVDFTVSEGKIFFALSAIKGCGGGAAEAIAAARREGGPFADLFDFCERVDAKSVNRAAIETLIKAGAFDSLGARRAQLSAVVERAIQAGAAMLKDRRSGQKNFFGDDDEDEEVTTDAHLPDVPEWEERDLLTKEREVLGYYRTSHPLAEYETMLRQYCSHTSAKLGKLPHRSEVVLGGMFSALKFSHTKNPRPDKPSQYVMFDLEDVDGIVRCILWPEQFVNYGSLVEPDAILAVCGKVDRRPGSEEVNLVVDEILPLDALASRRTSGLFIDFDEVKHGGVDGLNKLNEVLRLYPGTSAMRLILRLESGERVLCDCETRIDPTEEMRNRLEDMLGPGSYRPIMQRARPPAPPQQQRRRMAHA